MANACGTPRPKSIRGTILATVGSGGCSTTAARVTFFKNDFATVGHICVRSLLRTTSGFMGVNIISNVEVSAHPSTVSSRVLRLLGDCGMATVRLNTRDLGSHILGVGGHKRGTESIRGTSVLVGGCKFRLKLRVVAKLCTSSDSSALHAIRGVVRVTPSAIEVCPAIILGSASLRTLCLSGICGPRSLGSTMGLTDGLCLRLAHTNVHIVELKLRSVRRNSCITNP